MAVAEYAPDDDAFDSLVDLDGLPLPPTEAELSLAALEPIDALEVVAAMRSAIDLAENFIISGTGTPEDRLMLYVTLVDALNPQSGSLPAIRRKIGERLAPDLGRSIEMEGRWWLPGRVKSVTGWRKDELKSAVNRVAMAPIQDLDKATGELIPRPPTGQEILDRMWKLVDVATGRSAKLREAGIDEDEYATVTWKDGIDKAAGPLVDPTALD